MEITKQDNTKKILLLIAVAFLFSIAVRLIWVYQFSGYEPFIFNNQFMINTNDGYYYAEGARDILSGIHQPNDLSPLQSAPAKLTAFFAMLLPFSFESILFYMPAFLASLVVVPLILIGKSLGEIEVGFVGALVASIAMSYYNRTMVGYYDSDMLNIVFPTFLLWSLILALRTKEQKYILFTALEIIAYRWWYPQSYSLELAFFGLLALFVLYLFIKKEDVKFEVLLLSFMLFAMMGLDDLVRLIIVVVLFVALQRGLLEKYGMWLLVVALGAFFATGGFDPIWGQLKNYVFKDALLVSKGTLELHYYSVMQTIREAGKIPFDVFSSRISGHPISFVLAFVGYLWLAYRYKIMLLGLPLVGLGFLAYFGGLRFTIYAVPVLGLGIGFLIVQLASLTNTNLKRNIFILLLTLLALAPNIEHIVGYKVPTVFAKPEVEVLDRLKNMAQREDYVVGWWDYGYPIRYYADVKTLSDGGKHSGAVNFATSFALTHKQDVAAKMLRLDVEYTEKYFSIIREDENLSEDEKRYIPTMMENSTLSYDFNDTNDFLRALETPLVLPVKTRDIYLYLPARMLQIYPTITLFSNLDLMSGIQGHQPFLFVSQNFQDNGTSIELGQGVRINKQSGYVEIGKQQIALKSFINTYYTPDGKLQVDKSQVRYDGEAYAVYMRDYRQFVIVDKDVYNSTYFQLFVLEHYDENLYEPTMLTPNVKVYKLKI